MAFNIDLKEKDAAKRIALGIQGFLTGLKVPGGIVLTKRKDSSYIMTYDPHNIPVTFDSLGLEPVYSYGG